METSAEDVSSHATSTPLDTAAESVPTPQREAGESETARLTRDCLTVIFANLSPMALWSVSLVCQRWRRIALLRWNKRAQKELTSWLKVQLQDNYLPYRRLSYYDRDYKTLGLAMTWPKQPLRIINVFQMSGSVDAQFATERLQELFKCPKLQMHHNTQYINDRPHDATVTWEGHQVQLRVECLAYEDNFLNSLNVTGRHFLGDAVRSNECVLVWGTGNITAWAEGKCAEWFDWHKKKPEYQKDFGGTANAFVAPHAALIRSFGALTASQIMHLVRGELPECFPSLEEFEAVLPQSIVDKSKANFENFLEQAKSGQVGIKVPPPAPEPWSWNPTRWFWRPVAL